MKRVLVIGTGAGAGHNRAAEAVAATAAGREDVACEWFDALDTRSKVFRKLYADSYVMMATRSPMLWGLLYQVAGKKADTGRIDRWIRAYDRAAYRPLMNRVEEFRPDAVVCTHFLPANVLTAHKVGVPVFVAVTDYDVHPVWVNQEVSGYFVGAEEVGWLLRHHGIPEPCINVTGIPIHPGFSRTRGRSRVRRELGLQGRAPVVLFMSGGFGMTDMAAAVRELLSIDRPLRVLAVCGRNEKMRKKLQTLVSGAKDRLKVFGFVDNVPDFMEAADLIVTKAGGLSVSECLARALPMALFSPIPGQEGYNSDFLLEEGTAVKVRGQEVLAGKVARLLADRSRLASMREAAARIARPDAAGRILDKVLEEVK